MKLSIYLHSDIVDVLKTYGKLDDVVNSMLDAADEGEFEIENKPECRPREGAGRYDVNVTNATYLSLLNTYGVKSKAISLRRLIYWFVENEIFNEIGWETVNDFVDRDTLKWNKQIDKVLNELERLKTMCNYSNSDVISHAEDLISNCRR